MGIDTNLYIKPGHLKPLGLDRPQQRRLLSVVRGLQHLANKYFMLLDMFYLSRGERAVCQIGAFVLARVLSARFDLPISRTLPREVDHIEITLGISVPEDIKKAEHQTFLKVFLSGKTLYVDPTFLVLSKGRRLICVREYPAERFDQELAKEMGIEPYDPQHPAYRESEILTQRGPQMIDWASYVEQSLAMLHSPQLISEGAKITLCFDLQEWIRVNRIISSLEPKAALPPLEYELERLAVEQGPASLIMLDLQGLFRNR